MYELILIDGEYPLGDGSGGNPDEQDSYCNLNPGQCDIIGAFFNGVCVGWNFASSDEGIYENTLLLIKNEFSGR